MSISKVISLQIMDEAKSAFDTFDSNSDGYIEPQLIERALRAVGLNPTSEEMIDILRDTGNCMISYFSFLYIIYRHSRNVDTEAELVDSLRVLDKDDSGRIYVEDLVRLCKSIRRPFTDEQIQSVLNDSDVVKGKVDYKDFVQKLLYQ